MAQVTIKDIAKLLNISPSTVSRALQGHPDISAKTKERVIKLADEFDYHPNSIAKSLQNKKTSTIGVVVPEIKHDFFSSAISGIEEVAYESGYTIMVCQSNEDHHREIINTHAMLSNRVAGLLVSISQNTQNFDHFQTVIRQGIPVVFFDRVSEEIPASRVMINDRESAFMAVEHLIKRGYQRIAHITGPLHINNGRDRYQGYREAIKANGIPFEKELIVSGGFNERDGRNGAKKLLSLKNPPDAIFAVNDPVAIGAYIHIKEKGLHIPEDIALVGFSNNPISALIDPALTTVDQPAFEMGKAAAKLLLEQFKSAGSNFKPIVKVMETRLIIRGSS